jgi:hypothetical protein
VVSALLLLQNNSNEQRVMDVCEHSRKLLYDAGSPALRGQKPPWVDNPAAFLRGLEQTAEGCRWLLEQWGELRTLIDRGLKWTRPDRFKLVRLLGKFPTEAVNDSKLNALFLAWDVLEPGSGERFWSACKRYQTYEAAFSDEQEWRELADRPRDQNEASAFLSVVIQEQVARLQELLSAHEEIAGEEAEELADRASFDATASFERLRRYESAKNRELKQTLETFFKVRKPEPEVRARSGQMTNATGQMTNATGPMADDEGLMRFLVEQLANAQEQKTDGKGRKARAKGQEAKENGQTMNDNPLAALPIARLAEVVAEPSATEPQPQPEPDQSRSVGLDRSENSSQAVAQEDTTIKTEALVADQHTDAEPPSAVHQEGRSEGVTCTVLEAYDDGFRAGLEAPGTGLIVEAPQFADCGFRG